MAGLKINNSDYPGVAGASIVESILSLNVLDHWFMFHPDHVTQSGGKVTALHDIINPGTVSMVQATTSKQVALADDIFGIAEPEGLGLIPAGNFVKAAVPLYGLSGATFNALAPFSIIGTFRRRDDDSENAVLCGTQSGTNPFWVGFTGGSNSMTLRWGGVFGAIPFEAATGENYYAVEYDGTDLRGRANDGDWIEFAASGTPTSGGTFVWGSSNSGSAGNSWDGWSSDLITAPSAISGNATLLALLDEYMADVIGIG